MTALVLAPRPAPQHPPRWNWPRVGALSGALSLHFVALVLLLVPPAAMIALRPARDDPTWVDLIKPLPPPVAEPKLPQPKPMVHEVRRRPTPQSPPATTPPQVAESPLSSHVADPPAPTRDIAPPAPAEVAPVALAYHTRTKVPYPRDALQAHQQGTVVLRVLVGTDGLPQTVEVEQSSGSRSLDNAARDAVGRWTFQAGTRGGIPAPLWARVPISFTLELL